MKLYKDDKIFNPETSRYVKKSGTVGRRLERMTDDEYNQLGDGAGAGASTEEGGVKEFSQDQTKILNPKTQRFVAVSGATGRKLLKMSNEDYEKLKGGAPAPKKKPVKRSEALKQVIREQQAKTIVRGVRRSDEIMNEARDRIQQVVQENPEVAIIPPSRTIRDVAQALARGQMQEIMPVPLERQDTELEQYQEPSQEGANYLDILLNVADVLDEITEQLEEQELEQEEIENILSNLVEQVIREERMAEIKNIKEELKKEQEMDEEVWNDQEYDLYALEPVQDDTPEYRNTWEDAVNRLNELVVEEFGEDGVEEKKEEEEAKEEAKEEGQVFDELTTAMGMDNMGEEEKRERNIDDAIEQLGRNLMNLEFLDSGRGAYMATNTVPDPHKNAFDHIEENKKK